VFVVVSRQAARISETMTFQNSKLLRVSSTQARIVGFTREMSLATKKFRRAFANARSARANPIDWATALRQFASMSVPPQNQPLR
jgi:hypothetical protein